MALLQQAGLAIDRAKEDLSESRTPSRSDLERIVRALESQGFELFESHLHQMPEEIDALIKKWGERGVTDGTLAMVRKVLLLTLHPFGDSRHRHSRHHMAVLRGARW